ncbi:hypothetical protein [Fulvivirga sediminis]|uniref:Secreted protein n=1 Tax=Fulvivirga sediminis TaxID=2803949 RepID=A0A937FCS1_9BACT|nr:hypothetical protein [Fulvivirga sediminis]MBL3658399.1 hypothetical protein [Fulvivirga sediminis]
MKIVKLISLLFILGVFLSATSCQDPYDEITHDTEPGGGTEQIGPRD